MKLAKNNIWRLQKAMSALPQTELPTEHFFADGMYARVVSRLAGVLIVGKVHKREHFYIVTKGRVSVTDGNSEPKIYSAGEVVVSKPGTKRAVLALEDSICMTIHRTSNTSIDEIEKELIEDDPTALFDSGNLLRDRTDYLRILDETGFTHEERRQISENSQDLIPMPEGYNVILGKSLIEGTGIFVTKDIPAGEIIAPARIGDKRTPVGRFINHSALPNAKMELRETTIYAVSLRSIQIGEEVTVNYRQAKLEGEKS